jgi:hypothetical protein
MNIYVVQGSCGRYEEFEEWLVCAFKDEQKAKDFVMQLTQEGQDFIQKYDGDFIDHKYGALDNDFKPETRFPPNDKNFQWNYSGFNYTYFAVELRE